MQPFRLRLDARQWFKDLKDQGVFKIDLMRSTSASLLA